jgi:CheY-like chemotaxis protein
MTDGRILIVDDNQVNLKLAQVTLRIGGYDVRTAADATEALIQVDAFQPDLILMDIQLPGMDGLELTRQIKGNSTTASTRVIALTAYAMKGDENRAIAAGCDAYVAKPIDTRTLPQVVANCLTRGPVAPR